MHWQPLHVLLGKQGSSRVGVVLWAVRVVRVVRAVRARGCPENASNG